MPDWWADWAGWLVGFITGSALMYWRIPKADNDALGAGDD